MAKFTSEQVVIAAAVQQLTHDWARELDVNNGLHISALVTDDCTYNVGGTVRQGRVAIEKFYKDRLERLSAQPAGVPTQRHALSNLRVTFRSADEVSITLTLIYFTTAGMAAGLAQPDPAAVADVRMDCRRGDDAEWRIAMFDSNQPFRRVAP